MDTVRKKAGIFNFVVMVSVGLLFLSGLAAGTETGNPQHYKMVSTVEYVGAGQFRNQVETLFSVESRFLSDGKVEYLISNDLDVVPEGFDNHTFGKMSFVVDKRSRHLSTGKGLSYWQKVSNESVKSLSTRAGDNIGRMWKESFKLSSLGERLPAELNCTLTSMKVNGQGYGEMTAVRSLSEPFLVKTPEGIIAGKVNSVYLFDAAIEEVYMSISVFIAATTANGIEEVVRHEVATYKTDSSGVPVDLSGLGEEFENFAAKVGLSERSCQIEKECSLPRWAKVDALNAAQVGNICTALACEGALNPVATISIPLAEVIELQKNAGNKEYLVAKSQLAAKESQGVQEKNIFEQIKDNWGWNLPTAAVVGGTTVGIVAIAGGFSSSGGSSSSSP